MSIQVKWTIGRKAPWQAKGDPRSLRESISEQKTAIDGERGTGDGLSVVRSEEGRGTADVDGSPHPAPGEGRVDLLDELGAQGEMLAGRVDPTGLGHVYIDPMADQLDGDRTGEVVQPGLGGVVGNAPRVGTPGLNAR